MEYHVHNRQVKNNKISPIHFEDTKVSIKQQIAKSESNQTNLSNICKSVRF